MVRGVTCVTDGASAGGAEGSGAVGGTTVLGVLHVVVEGGRGHGGEKDDRKGGELHLDGICSFASRC